MLSAHHFDSPRNVAWCLLRQRTASKAARQHYDTANHEVQFVNVITGEEASNPDPQLPRPPSKSLKQTFVQAIYPSIAYLLHMWRKKHCIFHSRKLATRRVGCTAENWGWPMTVSAPDYLGLAVHTFCKDDTYTDVVWHWGAFVK